MEEQAVTAAIESTESESWNDQPREIRKKHLNHEASIESIGLLYYIGGILGCIIGVISLFNRHGETLVSRSVSGVIILAVSIAQIYAAWGLRRLKSWARIPTILLSCIGLLGFPVGTIINAYILYLVAGKKGAYVFSDEYKAIIQLTPDIKYKTSIVVWIILIVFTLLLLSGIVMAMTAR